MTKRNIFEELLEGVRFTVNHRGDVPYFYYTDGKSLYQRLDFTKAKLLERFGGDSSKTEEELANDNGFSRYYTTGKSNWLDEFAVTKQC